MRHKYAEDLLEILTLVRKSFRVAALYAVREPEIWKSKLPLRKMKKALSALRKKT